MATNPATAPLIAPSTLGLPFRIHSAAAQPKAAAAVAKCVVTNALLANPPAATALPALKPNQPTHSKQAPMNANTTLCGAKFSLPYPTRLPMYSAQTSADTPELMWTTVPPAKSTIGPEDLHIDGAVLAFTTAVSILSGILFGLAPAITATRGSLSGWIKSMGRGHSGSRWHGRQRALILTLQTGVAVLLLIGAGLLVRSFWKMQSVNPGFRPRSEERRVGKECRSR